MRTSHGMQHLEWAGQFGNDYAKRSPGDVQANEVFFARILAAMNADPISAIEFGCGVGNNLRALRTLLPDIALRGVEINESAAILARQVTPLITIGSMLVHEAIISWELAFTKGVLIHIPPVDLPRAYEVLYRASRKYIMVAEYYAPKPTEIEYRGRRDMLWKGPHAYDMLDRYQDLKLLDYGFVSSRDPYPQDDLNWWILEKRP